MLPLAVDGVEAHDDAEQRAEEGDEVHQGEELPRRGEQQQEDLRGNSGLR